MKKSMFFATGFGMVLLGLGCGVSLPDEIGRGELNQSTDEDDLDAMFQLSDEETEYQASDETSEGDKIIVETLKSLHKEAHLAVAECAGIGAEAQAFEAKKSELEASGIDKATIREQLREDHEALMELLRENSEALRSCKEELKDSEVVSAIRTGIQACWELPEQGDGSQNGEFRGERPKGAKGSFFGLKGPNSKRAERGERGPHGHRGPEGRRGKRPGLPPKEFANFDSEECQKWVASREITE